MTTTILPLFPLQTVAFPGEPLSLHVFEDRYQQLLRDCESSNSTFGIPTYINNRLEYGTEMQIVKVAKRYPSGAADIICKGIKVFKLVDFYKTFNEKLYAGGEVFFLTEEQESISTNNKETFVKLLRAFYDELDMETPSIDLRIIRSFTLAHKMGLTIEQEYELIQMTSEDERLKFLIEHLNIALPTLRSVNRTKRLIALNGHFKNFDPLDYEYY